MPVAITEVPVSAPGKHWTRAECEALESTGALVGQNLELVEGRLINKMGKNRPHSISLEFLHYWLWGVFGAVLHSEVPIDVAPHDNPTNEPQPDLIVLRQAYFRFKKNPRPDDVLLVVEVSDTTLAFDLGTKARLYARAGIPEYCVLDVAGRRMIVHRDPRGGRYQSVVTYRGDEKVFCLAAPSSELRVGDAFPG